MRVEIDIPDTIMPSLEQAARDGVTLEQEVLRRLAQPALSGFAQDPAWQRIKALNEQVLKRRNGEPLPDAAEIIIQSRLHDH